MATNDDEYGARPDDLVAARNALVDALGSVGAPAGSGGEAPDLVKAGDGGMSVELRFNGAAIPLDGAAINTVPAADFAGFLERHKLAIESGELDQLITATLDPNGTGKVTAQVRAVGRIEASD